YKAGDVCAALDPISTDDVWVGAKDVPLGTFVAATAVRGDLGGSRLAGEYLVASDGAEQFHRLVDAQLDQPCAFYKASDGSLRCLPSVGFAATSTEYADASCTQPLAMQIGGCKRPSYVESFAPTCDATVRLWDAGCRFSGATVFGNDDQMACGEAFRFPADYY